MCAFHRTAFFTLVFFFTLLLHRFSPFPSQQREQLRKFDEAIEVYGRALEIKRSSDGVHHFSVGHTLYNMACLHMDHGKLAKAADLMQQVMPTNSNCPFAPLPSPIAANERLKFFFRFENLISFLAPPFAIFLFPFPSLSLSLYAMCVYPVYSLDSPWRSTSLRLGRATS